MNTEGTTQGPFKTFLEETAGELLNKQYHAVKLGATPGTVALCDVAADAIGVLWEEEQFPHSQETTRAKHVTVRLFGAGGTYLAKTAGVIAFGASVQPDASGNGTFIAGATPSRGKNLSAASASGDVIEVLDQV